MKCTVCDEIAGDVDVFGEEYSLLVQYGKHVLCETEQFIVVPSIGAMNASHCMIVPKIHVNSCAQLTGESMPQIRKIVETLEDFMRSKSNESIFLFEHGTGSNSDLSGSCVGHAHLHVIVSVAGLLNSLLSTLKPKRLDKYESLLVEADLPGGYVFFGDCSSVYLRNSPGLPSQFFRQQYVRFDSRVSGWNWRTNFNIDMVKKVIDFYGGLSV